jgi:hypothetical protein
MSSTPLPVACDRLAGLIDGFGEDAPDRIVTHTILDHLATCPTCCRAEAVLTRLLADYRFTAESSLPAGSLQRLVERICGPARECEQGD